MTAPLVSVIIPTRNCARTIERCLLSLRAQTYPHIEIIVVDNASSDGTPQLASPHAQVLHAGPERSAQFNHGARRAQGDYLYRIDGDFVLDPGVIAACVAAVEYEGWDAIAVPNRSQGRGYWSRVRAYERDTYLGDPDIVAARFWKRAVFEALGGFDESLVACEDYDLHNRLLQGGYRVGRVEPGEMHLGESDRLADYAARSFYYSPSFYRYLEKHPRRGARQMFPVRRAYLRHGPALLRQPHLLAGLVILKLVEYAAVGAGILSHVLGLTTEQQRVAAPVVAALLLVCTAAQCLILALPGSDPALTPAGSLVACGAGIAAWQAVGRRRARQTGAPLMSALPPVALAFSPLLLLLLAPPGDLQIAAEQRQYAASLSVAACLGWLGYLAEPWPALPGAARRVPAGAVVCGAALFAAVLGLRSVVLLRAQALGSVSLAAYDQALWLATHGAGGEAAAPALLYTSVYGQSLFAAEAAPALLVYLPAYLAGLGGPALLLVSQSAAIALGALALFRYAGRRIGSGPAALCGLAYLLYFVNVRNGSGVFNMLTFAAPAFLLAADAGDRRDDRWYYGLIAAAILCGLDAALAALAFGLYRVVFRRDYRRGMITCAMSAGWLWVAFTAFLPYFGGAEAQWPALVQPPADMPFLSYLAARIGDAVSWRYAGALLAPVAFVALLGAPLLLPALPRLVLNLLAGDAAHTALDGAYEVIVVPFVFMACVAGLAWLGAVFRKRGWPPPERAGSLVILAACATTCLFLAPNVFQDILASRDAARAQAGEEVMRLIPDSASVAAQSPLSAGLAHRPTLTVLPQVADAQEVLFDAFNPNRGPQPESYPDVLSRVYRNPSYGLRAARQGYLLFERGIPSQDKLKQLALADAPDIQYARNVVLSDTVAYLGFDLSATRATPGQPIYITHYWKSLQPAPKPYLLFTAYPGAYRFEVPVFGLFPVAEWPPGAVVRHEQRIDLPALPDGDSYEIVAGLWYDTGTPALRSSDQLLGGDVVRIATIRAAGGQYDIRPWASSNSRSSP